MKIGTEIATTRDADQTRGGPGLDLSDHSETVCVLKHIARYRLSTFEFLQKLPPFVEAGPGQLRRILADACRQELLLSAPLHRGLRYWALAPAGALRCGLPKERSGFLSERAKLNAFAMLQFCQRGPIRTRLISEDFKRPVLSTLARAGMPGSYYLTSGENGRIGLARIDAGRHGRWDRILHSVGQDCDHHRSLAAFRPFLQTGRFEITIVTMLAKKAERLANAVENRSDRFCLPVHVEAVPQLTQLLPHDIP